MTTYDKIELPPLPPADRYFEFDSHRMKASIPYWGENSLESYALAAIEADRKNTAEMLKNPVHVHINMCRGIIAPITFDQLAHVLGDEATEAWLADRQRRKPQHINPELKAATEYAATTRSPVAITKDGRGVMLNYGDEEDRMAEHEDNACAYCGGSGQQGDVADRRD